MRWDRQTLVIDVSIAYSFFLFAGLVAWCLCSQPVLLALLFFPPTPPPSLPRSLALLPAVSRGGPRGGGDRDVGHLEQQGGVGAAFAGMQEIRGRQHTPSYPLMKWWRRVCGQGFTAFIGWTGPGVGCPLSAAFTRASSAFLCLAILARAPPWTSDWRRACSREAFAFFLFFFSLPPPPRKFPGRSTTRAG